MKVRYTCPYCKETNEIADIWKWFWIPHMGAKKLIKCTRCRATSYMKRQDGRKWLDWPTEKFR